MLDQEVSQKVKLFFFTFGFNSKFKTKAHDIGGDNQTVYYLELILFLMKFDHMLWEVLGSNEKQQNQGKSIIKGKPQKILGEPSK